MTDAVLAGIGRTSARLLVVGGAATLRVPGAGGMTVQQDPEFPASLRAIAAACADQHAAFLATGPGVDWTYLSPAAQVTPGRRTGNYRLGTDELVTDEDGNSAISMEDLAVALLNEAETPKHRRSRFTVGY